jgi:thiol:disulfide interchange protein DsbC
MKTVNAMLGSLLLCASVAVSAQSTEETLKKTLEPRLGDGAKIESVTKTPYSGLYEVQIDGDIVYTDAKGELLFIGRVVDSKTFRDYTKERVQSLNSVKFSDLPLDLAIKTVKGNGKRVIAVFEDPNCGYCKQLHKNLQAVDNLTVYTFTYNILSKDSIAKSHDILCSANPTQAWSDWMINGKVPAKAAASCPNDVHDKVFALGRSLKITGTPTVFFTDGSRIPGAIDAKGLEQKLATVK